ncbi:MAG: hypothetical protein KDI81_10300, partial [Xanthomonadales bacterium]|nr:hypothetical protein [Xanthomonadales bacterium]
MLGGLALEFGLLLLLTRAHVTDESGNLRIVGIELGGRIGQRHRIVHVVALDRAAQCVGDHARQRLFQLEGIGIFRIALQQCIEDVAGIVLDRRQQATRGDRRTGQVQLRGNRRPPRSERLLRALADGDRVGQVRIDAQGQFGTVECGLRIVACLRGLGIGQDALREGGLERIDVGIAAVGLPSLLEPVEGIVAGRLADASGRERAARLVEQRPNALRARLRFLALLDLLAQVREGRIGAEFTAQFFQRPCRGIRLVLVEQAADAGEFGIGQGLQLLLHVRVLGIKSERGTQQRVGAIAATALVTALCVLGLAQQFIDAPGNSQAFLLLADALDQGLHFGIVRGHQQRLIGAFAGSLEVAGSHRLLGVGAQQAGDLAEQFEALFVFGILLQDLLQVFERIRTGRRQQVPAVDHAVGFAKQGAHEVLVVLAQGAWLENGPEYERDDEDAEARGDAGQQARAL